MAYTGKPAGSDLYDVYTQADVDNGFVAKDGSGNVSITGNVTVSGSTLARINLTDTSGTDQNVFLDSTNGFAQFVSQDGTSNGGFFFKGYNGTSSTTQMTIDSAGRVTMPYQPYFAAEMIGNGSYVSFAENTVLPFNNAPYNVGNCFNASTYRFTAPVTGKYLFTVSVIVAQSAPIGRMCFYVNDNQEGNNLRWGISGSGTAGGGDTNASAIIYLNAGDYVDARSQFGTLTAYQDNHSSFTGMLLG